MVRIMSEANIFLCKPLASVSIDLLYLRRDVPPAAGSMHRPFIYVQELMAKREKGELSLS